MHEDIEQRASAHQTVDALGLDQTELTEEARILAAERVRARSRNDTFLPRALFTRHPAPGRTPPTKDGLYLGHVGVDGRRVR